MCSKKVKQINWQMKTLNSQNKAYLDVEGNESC